ncbi:MAG: peroxiredoxin-like family protein [Cyclobacteriaceae bacterium]
MSITKEVPSYTEELQELQGNLQKMLPAEALEVFDQDAQALQANYISILKLNRGDAAPDFSLTNAVGEIVKLSDLLQKNKVVLTFYRGTWCPYCNLQLQQYQRALPEIKALGAGLVAISPQTPDESLSMKEKNELQFEVLSDNGNMVARQYTTIFVNGQAPVAAMTSLGIDFNGHYSDDSQELPVPAVFVIEQDGTVLLAQTAGGDYRNRVEVADVLNALS